MEPFNRKGRGSENCFLRMIPKRYKKQTNELILPVPLASLVAIKSVARVVQVFPEHIQKTSPCYFFNDNYKLRILE